MLPIDLTGKRAFVAGVADDGGYGFAAAKALAEAGATVCVGTWPPALTIFQNLLERGKMADSMRLATLTTSPMAVNCRRCGWPRSATITSPTWTPMPMRSVSSNWRAR